MTNCNCMEAELLAGTIALGEADEPQLERYRRHLAICAECRSELGGERDIARVMATTAAARDAERWQPDLRAARRTRRSARISVWQLVAGAAAAAAIVLGVQHAGKHSSSAVPVASVSSEQAERAIAALGNQTGPRREHQAESLVVDSAPATMALKMRIDGRGTPERCTVTKSSGHRSLDEAVCRAAMRPLYEAPAQGRP